ncbi:DUF1993 domain-containing protein [Massilia sp. IC2-477]|uniref:DUF1993 family protein n=1 Tax=Massilia sp. IC2-477 TaxID=2887198 RepID=UPI001D10FB7F|nr:DUF1993 family protein [Massilia sp. IC2-477]MCC2954733.1 DUF1993 domain-containing protein [Massilia sp. IC2-477]
MVTPTRLFLHYLDRLRDLLKRIEVFGTDISGKRLHPDMLPLLQQAKTAIGFALRTSCPLAGREIVSFSNDEYTLQSVFVELDLTTRYLSTIPDTDFGDFDALKVGTAAGFADLNMPAWDYYLMYAVPNFFFHYSMVYAIARQAGVPIGKADFDGYHKYPPGFSFTEECDPSEA